MIKVYIKNTMITLHKEGFNLPQRYPLDFNTLITMPISTKKTTTRTTSTHILLVFLYFSSTPYNALDLF